MKAISFLFVISAFDCCVHSLPPDKNQHQQSLHIIKTRSIDVNNAYSLSLETRLEQIVEPTGYKLDIEPYLEDGLFKGHVKINITWVKESDEVSLHCAHELEIIEYQVHAKTPNAKDLQNITVTRLSIDSKKPIMTIHLDQVIPKTSEGYLEFRFKGQMVMASSEAFFRTTYKTEQEEERIVAATQFRPNNARRMFPCFDEPGFKAPFELSVVRPKNMVALSNTPILKTEEIAGEPDAVRVYFERTPPMSTFTLGLVIAELQQLGTSTHYKDANGNDIELRAWGRAEYLTALEGLNERIKLVFTELANYWQVPLPLKQLDIVALPNYRGFKPADNWGLIVFRESDIPKRGYQLELEIAYHWLGALTTPAWWNESYVNKGLTGFLATEISFKLDSADSENLWPIRMLYSIYYELSKRYPNSRITGLKQEIACNKIELLFRLLNYTIGANTFKKGLTAFIETKKFKTFVGDDIWNALNDVAVADGKIPKDINLRKVAESWTANDRLPAVTVTRNYDKNTARITQKVYLRERPHDVPNADKLLWWIPLVLIRGDNLDFKNTTPIAWTKHKELTLENMPSKDHFVIVNPDEIGPFPVNYDERNWDLLLQYLLSDKRETIPALTRAKLLHDAWNLAYAGELSFASALNMTLFLKNEKDFMVWDPMFVMIDHIGRQICPCIKDKFRKYIRIFLSPFYEELTKEKEIKDIGKKKFLGMLRNVLCKNGYRPCLQKAREAYSTWMTSPNPDEGNPVPDREFCPIFQWGTQEEWDFALQRVINFPSARSQSERTYLLKTLIGCPTDEYKINKLLNISIIEGNGNFSETDLNLMFSMLTGDQAANSVLLNYLDKHWDFLKTKFRSKTNLWDNLISDATGGRFTTQGDLDSINKLYVAHQGEFGSAEHIIEHNIKNIREEVKWSAENIPVIEKWLDNYIANSNVKDDFIGNSA
ncbi:aminopeptidase N [Leptidea sinapis]|uniref:aminopeptidase N n=1 Tax=Leptidea sinapis TaxID=189913 RepID=UPI002142B4BD|nr:aminopeptidase N [Leptidea sinapis]XP_050667557.1 aminopeptidase N [Leptidea sinapis]